MAKYTAHIIISYSVTSFLTKCLLITYSKPVDINLYVKSFRITMSGETANIM